MKRSSILFKSIVFITILFWSGCKKEETCVENVKDNCICYMIYLPVCGCNGKTYDNDCVAACAGITEYTGGACE